MKVGSLLHLDGQWVENWVFEEMLIDSEVENNMLLTSKVNNPTHETVRYSTVQLWLWAQEETRATPQ